VNNCSWVATFITRQWNNQVQAHCRKFDAVTIIPLLHTCACAGEGVSLLVSPAIQSVASVQQQQQQAGRPTQQVQPVSSHFEEATGNENQIIQNNITLLSCYFDILVLLSFSYMLSGFFCWYYFCSANSTFLPHKCSALRQLLLSRRGYLCVCHVDVLCPND